MEIHKYLYSRKQPSSHMLVYMTFLDLTRSLSISPRFDQQRAASFTAEGESSDEEI